MAKPTYGQLRAENIKVLIQEVKIRKKLGNKQLAKLLGVSESTFQRRQAHPGDFSMQQMWLMVQMAGVPTEELRKYL